MKKLLLVFSLMLFAVTAQSQILITLLLGDKLNSDKLEFGLEGGVNWSFISNLEATRPLSTFNLGFYFDLKIKENWFLYTGVLVKSNLGQDKLTDNDLSKIGATIYYTIEDPTVKLEGEYRQKLSYFIVPALIKYKFKNHMYAEAGPQFGLLYKSWVEFNSDLDGKEARLKEYNRDMMNRFDMGVTVGLGYTMFNGNGWTLGVKYYYGFVDVYKNISGTKNNSIFAKLNIPIGVADKATKNKEDK